MRILFALNSFKDLTGSELYVYELSKELSKLHHQITIWSDLGHGYLSNRLKKHGIKCFDVLKGQHPGFDFDILHLAQVNITEAVLNLLKGIPCVCTIHSEIIPIERPFIHPMIQTYICVRKSIQDYIVSQHSIDKEKTTVLYNPIDFSKFKSVNKKRILKKTKTVLFVGTIDKLRKNVILHLIEDSQKRGYDLIIVGEKGLDYLPKNLPMNVLYAKPQYSIENYYRMATECHSILMGRTAIEGWVCGMPSVIWDVDREGNILNSTLIDPPPLQELENFNSKVVANQIESLYRNTIMNYQIKQQ